MRWLPLLFILCSALPACSSSSSGPRDAAVTFCPVSPPSQGDVCHDESPCTWERCPADGVTTATCANGAWTVSTDACKQHTCPNGSTCGAGELCAVRAGGALLVECAANPCGDDAIEASCACALCGDLPCTVSGRAVTCNTCPGPQVCP